MRIVILGLTASALLLPGCRLFCPPSEGIPVENKRDTPELAFQTFRDALELGLANVIYESFSPEFKEKYGVPGLSRFKVGYQHYRDEFDELAALLDDARVTGTRSEEQGGRTYAFLSLVSGSARGDFVLIDLPSWEVMVEIEGYPPETAKYSLTGSDFSEVLLVRDGKLYVGPLDAGDAGIVAASEVLRLVLQHRWLLHDIRNLVNVRPLLEGVEKAAGAAR